MDNEKLKELRDEIKEKTKEIQRMQIARHNEGNTVEDVYYYESRIKQLERERNCISQKKYIISKKDERGKLKNITLLVSGETHEKIKMAAKKNNKSIAGYVIDVMELQK